MTSSRPIVPVTLVIAVFSRHRDALAWAESRLRSAYGPIELSTEPYLFDQTSYYEQSMGAELLKQLHAFREPVSPDGLPDTKRACIALERELAGLGDYAEERPLNVDPGYLTLGKFLLASTKDHSHRVYLRDGIFAEVTLRFKEGRFEPWPWTYADYKLPHVREFLLQVRTIYYERLRAG